MTGITTRRRFLQSAAWAGFGLWSGMQPSRAARRSPNEKLNVGAIGTTRRGGRNLQAVARSENIVALCDVDERRLAQAAEKHPRARRYTDFRRMLRQKDIDAVLVSTPDHTHAVAAIAAMEMGKHVYCEKPLAHSVFEARAMAESAERNGVVTQMGNQRHADDELRRVVEHLQAGVLGPVRKVIAWSSKIHSGGDRPEETPPVPPHLRWNLWLGPAPERPYHPVYHPRHWRGFWDFGSGNFGDMACHILDAPYWGLGLGAPASIEAEGPTVHPESAPRRLVVRYRFEREDEPPLELVWYDGEAAPPHEHLDLEGLKLPNQGALMIGERGQLLFPHPSGRMRLVPAGRFEHEEPPEPSLPRPKDHHTEWTEACKGRGRTYSDFRYGSRLTETVLAGVVAYRVGQRLEWDGDRMQATNCPEADPLIRPPLREGWSLKTQPGVR